jgi:hypothetical protein
MAKAEASVEELVSTIERGDLRPQRCSINTPGVRLAFVSRSGSALLRVLA